MPDKARNRRRAAPAARPAGPAPTESEGQDVDGANSDNAESIGNYVWRGGKKIKLGKVTDRLTIMPSSPEQLERVRNAPGVRKVEPMTNEVYRVETTTSELDGTMDALRSTAFNAITHHAYRPEDSEGTVYYITDRIVVVFDPNTTSQQINRLLEKYSLKVLKQYEGVDNTYLVQVTSSSGENPIKVANRLAEEKSVSSAEPNMVNRFQASFVPPDSLFPRQWHLSARDGAQLVASASVSAPEAWDVTLGDRKIVVAVIDDGFDLDHPDFEGQGKVVFPRDYVDGDANPFPTSEHHNYHGTPCAGVAIAESNGRGVVGVAPACAFMPVRFPLAADDDLLVEIFSEVSQHADVISCSWGPPPAFVSLSTLVSETFKNLATKGGPRGKGCVICFAAGNYNAPLRDPQNPNGHIWLNPRTGMPQMTTGAILNGFATHPNVIAVSSSTSLNKHAAYSNWGMDISVSAPSNNFHPLISQQFVPGRSIWTTDNEAFGDGFTANSRFTGRFGGTSSATPLVAGVAALVLSANPNLTAAEVKDILQSTADKIVDKDPDIVLGKNRGKYDSNGRCDWFGCGKVNAAKAVQEALRRKNS